MTRQSLRRRLDRLESRSSTPEKMAAVIHALQAGDKPTCSDRVLIRAQRFVSETSLILDQERQAALAGLKGVL